jgi:predicted nuclease of predicted toxin-antitoxin system
MTLLLDENISWRICRLIEQRFPGVVHVSDTSLGVTSTDAVIWEYARVHGHCIVTNDDDFHSIASVKSFPPKVILLRMGNQSPAIWPK